LITERTEVRLSQERQNKKQQHWQNIIINACEQSQRNRLPTLNHPVEFSALLGKEDSEQKLILHHHSEKALDKTGKPKSICLLVGPEGGFSEMEFKLATQHGFTPLTLGPRVLRTETAPLVALSVVQMLWGDF
jgi:16S rRNA (uracil1498-N3)-methyltransferase